MNYREKLQNEIEKLQALWNDNEPGLFTVCEIEREHMQNICDMLEDCGFIPVTKDSLELNKEEKELFGSTKSVIKGILAYRRRTGASLPEAKERLDNYRLTQLGSKTRSRKLNVGD